MWISTLPVAQAKYEKHSWLFFPDNSYQITNSADFTFKKVKIKNPSNLLPANATTAEKSYLIYLMPSELFYYIYIYLIAIQTVILFLILSSHNPVSSIPTFLNHTLIRPLFCTESFNVFSSHSGKNPESLSYDLQNSM